MVLFRYVVFLMVITLLFVCSSDGSFEPSDSEEPIHYGDPLTLGMNMGNDEEWDSAFTDPCDWYKVNHRCPIDYVYDSSGSGCPCVKVSDDPSYKKFETYIFDKNYQKTMNSSDSKMNQYLTLSDTYYKQGTYAESLSAAEQGIILDPNNALLWYNKGTALIELTRYSEAIKSLEKSTQLDPDSAISWNNLGYALEKLGKYSEALKAYNRASTLDPSDTLYKTNMNNVRKAYPGLVQ